MSLSMTLRAKHPPLAMTVSHASHTRTAGDSLLAVARWGEHVGLGEGCSRPDLWKIRAIGVPEDNAGRLAAIAPREVC